MGSQYLINLFTNMYFVLEWLPQKAETEGFIQVQVSLFF